MMFLPVAGILFPKEFALYFPRDLKYIPADGGSVLRSEYPELYQAIGDIWTKHFGLPIGKHFSIPKAADLMIVTETYRFSEQLKLFV